MCTGGSHTVIEKHELVLVKARLKACVMRVKPCKYKVTELKLKLILPVS